MKPFGALPRPTSRFRRPRQSWMRRLINAFRLRLTFLLVYALVMTVTVLILWPQARQYGYFYSPAERNKLWKELPSARSRDMLNVIYKDGPYHQMLAYLETPSDPHPEYAQLATRPEYRHLTQQLHQTALELELQKLEKNWRYAQFEGYQKLSRESRDLNSDQQARLRTLRRQVVTSLLEWSPSNEGHADQLCYRLKGTWSAKPPLPNEWRMELMEVSRKNTAHLLQSLQSQPDSLLLVLWRLRLQTCLLPLNSRQQATVAQLLDNYLGERVESPIQDQHLRVLAQCRKLLPVLTPERQRAWNSLADRLMPEQLDVLELRY